VSGVGGKIRKFIAKTPKGRYAAVARMWMRRFPSVPVPCRLWFGAWWLASPGVIDTMVMEGTFEPAELRFVEGFLKPGMTVLDVGGHHGLYTLLASKCVGKTGRVITFEPSSRERAILERHVKINRRDNVKIETMAVGSEIGRGKLFVVEGAEDGCNSLRPPNTESRSHAGEVAVTTIDVYLAGKNIGQVDFLKMDIEGAELDALKGSRGLLRSGARPVVLAEVYDIRTEPWGYKSREIVRYLEDLGYRWHKILEDGRIEETDTNAEVFDANLVAVPKERLPNEKN